MAVPLEDYALIGDCESAALVSRAGSIDWLCWPRFDSDACFAALLGDASNGRWLLTSRDPAARISRRYVDETLVLETRFDTSSGTARVLDFMPPRGNTSDVVRIVIGERGEVDMHTELVLRFGYGASVPWVTKLAPGVWRAIAGPDMTILRTCAPMRGQDLKSVANFSVKGGEQVSFMLTYARSHLEPPPPIDPDKALKDTEDFWREWLGKGRPAGRWSAAVKRSLITLRALFYAPTGGIVAAPTTSLPECIGGVRNWDYRYCWLRDATLALLALMNAGYYEEATRWRDWLVRAVAGSPRQLQIMYGLAGERRLTELELTWLAGYEDSRPVRIGNDAHAQLQLDMFGELMDALHQAREGGLRTTKTAWAVQIEVLAHLAEVWEQPDSGIWEMRGPARHFTHSKIMAWVAFDRAIKDATRFGLRGPVDQWRAVRARIHQQVCERGYDARRNTFVQSYGSDRLDASLLLIPPLGFLPPQDPRIDGTIRAVEKELLHDGFVLRYDTQIAEDGLPPGEGAFLACSFWLTDAYAMCGRRADAEALFERLLGVGNDVGLLAEQYDVRLGRMVGNFPQGFSHLALVNTAFNLFEASKPSAQRSER
ncbi:MAG TPA: glycoside hydrolase family 15 protein [Steroidobacter sp.]|nr:glycoside hydrolase family 15 protein [Steroidobacter sp.]